MTLDRKRIPATMLREAEYLLDGREQGAALELFHAAAQAGADADRCAAGCWMVHMLQGDFAAAWSASDAIRTRGAPDPHRLWNGEDIRGRRLIVRCLHGFGDAVQFLRYAPALRRMAKQVVYEVPPRMLDLAPCFNGVDNVITWGDHAPRRPPAWDVQVEVMELPYLLRTEVRDLPIAERYIRLPHPELAKVAEAMGPPEYLRVGVVWSAGEWNPARSIPFGALAPLLHRDDCTFWNLQGTMQGAHEGVSTLLHEITGCADSIVTLAAVISQLDLVITVDTLVAHLAGAMGVHAWVMLQYAADWRWMTGVSSSPWYPSLRLFRQPRPGDWAAVVADVDVALNLQCRGAMVRATA